ncbi:depupylase/deamidase Dop [Corynebacterium epidermidicanis]|uniref:Proteasome accessory factor PafA2 n=1 Tax=Corynebacterium epidermidicanis TaxID=1050174 RepID=A0A0G3GUD8_9CORY|nr:depupylase/deamidase Dop [Corynebacterium epidermidicanis]AKK03138.1 proteasome accessory factor PafA2 [Corynebacterium epidermidicanis]
MSRFLGTETEYGIASPTMPTLSPIITSTHLVVSYAAKVSARRSHWDFASEHPLRDQRGFDLKRYHTVPVIDPNAVGVANMVTSNGARFYVDHAHPEYSAPETTNAWDAFIYDAAGDLIVSRAVAATTELAAQGKSAVAGHEPCPPLQIYKHNVDGKGASFGSHENYLYSRSTDFDVLAQSLIPFFVARQVITGAGRVGLGVRGEIPGFQISQRADYIEQEISLETTLNRGIINTRDEPHASEGEFGRLHVIIGDANMSHTSNFLKLGMTSLVLDAIEQGVEFRDLQLVDAVREVQRVSRDLTLTHRLDVRDGRSITALDILREYHRRCTPVTEVDLKVHQLWGEVMDLLESDPLQTAHLLDWTAKLALMRGFIDRGLTWSDPKIALIDLQYCSIDPEKSLYHALVRKQRMRTLVDASAIAAAADEPPADSRAYFRGMVMQRWGSEVLAASWDTIQLATSATAAARIYLPRLDLLTRTDVEKLASAGTTAPELVDALEHHAPALVQRIAHPSA